MLSTTEFIKDIEAKLAECLFEGNILAHRKAIVERLDALHKGYSQDRNDFFTLISDDLTARGYAVYYGIVNAAKIYHLLSHFDDSFSPTSVLDFGAGSGAATAAVLATYSSIKQAVIVEHNNFMKNVATKVIHSLQPQIELNTYQNFDTCSAHLPQKYDLIIAANSLNEMQFEQRFHLFTQLLDSISDNGYLLILEPGSRDITRQLMELRERFCNHNASTQNQFEIIYPCTHHIQCELLRIPDQWCHSEMILERTSTMRILDTALSLNKHTVSFSALIIRKNSKSNVNLPSLYRVITEPRDTKVGTSSYICGGDYQGLVMLQKRDRTDENRYFKKLKMHATCPWITEFKKL